MAHADLDLRRIGVVVALLVAIIGFVVVAAFVLLGAWRAPTGGADASATSRDARSLYAAPQDALRAHRAAKRAWLDSAGWVDEAHGIAHIPIDDARALLLEEGKREGGRGKGNSPGPDGSAAEETPPSHSGAARLPLGAAARRPDADFRQEPGARLPLDLDLVDDEGKATSLRAQFVDGRPVLLVLGYYTCPNLCGMAMHGVLEALHDTGLQADEYRIVGVSIDPGDGPAAAGARARVYDAYARFVFGSRQAPQARLFVADAPAIDALAGAVGFRFERAADAGAPAAFAHPTGFVVATPDGRISRTLTGVRFDPRALRLALVDASSGRIGGFSDRVRLLCAHFDPDLARYDTATMNAARATGVVTVMLLGGWIARRLRGARRIARVRSEGGRESP